MNQLDYRVVTEKDGHRLNHHVLAQTPQLAAKMAEKERPGSEARQVSVTWGVVGRCGRCGYVIFDHEKTNVRRGEIRCESC